ncbi:DUF6153 family protein [Microbacterium rhizophilus]|uniref:DUF6153 family protein n=1 Tax=Microbacterium rhizophilus TaxID=3138934 RepID=UPI0031E8EE5A
MSVMTLRRAMHPSASVARTFLLTAAAVVAVLIGLLGMHVLSSGSAHHAPVVISESTHHGGERAMVDVTSADAATATAGDHSATEPCAEDGCGGGTDAMAFMACVLALLAVSVVLAIRPGRVVTIARAQAPPHAPVTLTEAPPVPPDLNVLSISRT